MELSERLKENYEKIGTQGWQSIFDDVMDNLPAIIAALDASEHNAKCVQFAEDVEKLAAETGITIYCNSGGTVFKGPAKIQYIRPDGKMEEVLWSNIYTAARKAVEALTNGEG